MSPELVDALYEQEARKKGQAQQDQDQPQSRQDDPRYPKARTKLYNIDPQMRKGIFYSGHSSKYRRSFWKGYFKVAQAWGKIKRGWD